MRLQDEPQQTSSTHGRRISWTTGSFVISFGLRFVSNVILSRLLSPELFGIVIIVNTIRFGVELLSDVGIEQNIVRRKGQLDRDFLNSAWTVQVVRGFILSAIFASLASPLSTLFAVPPATLYLMSLAPLLTSLHSSAIFVLSRTLQVRERNWFELRCEILAFAVVITTASLWHSVYAVILSTLISIALRSALSYRLPHAQQRLRLRRAHAKEIISFGKWITASSLFVYAAANIDRLTLGAVAPLAALGIYGIARIVSDIPSAFASRLTHQILFPAIAAESSAARETASAMKLRHRLLLLISVASGILASTADFAVSLVYDQRYSQAGPLLSIILLATWFSINSTLSEAAFLGRDRPIYLTTGNLARLVLICLMLYPLYTAWGLAGAGVAIIAAEAGRYLVTAYGLWRLKLHTLRQDFLTASAFTATILIGCTLRYLLGLGYPWTGL
ncbi:Membrane protein involved in the export of O-antigen and teichoic acid [Klenkia soli]|uniref:Membrane protein involved in the export of O-antigen and teichoic acid n=1 Tax=Klenkia soli TaxID=1052260 RepID=A0A1H0NWP0_9ACTN|nr:oligosaccharide flippase family protein [Klenkia soli]SDO97053.1 Membrane protein involved in the export of O-antigen and teichoic acid [Klenkia soli]